MVRRSFPTITIAFSNPSAITKALDRRETILAIFSWTSVGTAVTAGAALARLSVLKALSMLDMVGWVDGDGRW